MFHRISRYRWRLRRETHHASRFIKRSGTTVLLGVGAAGLVLHLLAGLPLRVALYEVVRTFLLDSDASLWDHEGTAAWVRSGLWFLRFAAPALFGGAILDLLSGLMPEPHQVPSWMAEHVIVVGAGRLGFRVATALIERGEPVVVINLNEGGDGLRRLREQEGVIALVGDARDVNLLDRAGAARASRLIAVTGSDVVNLSVALMALDPAIGNPSLRAWAHLHDRRLEDMPTHLERDGIDQTRLGTFSLYHDGADHFCQRHCTPEQGWTMAVIAGYGRFGKEMRRSLRSRFGRDWPIVVIDRHPGILKVRSATPVHADLLAADSLRALADHLPDAADSKVLVIVSTDSDAANIAFALRLRDGLQEHDVTVFTRLYEWPHGRATRPRVFERIEPIELWEEAGRSLVNRILGEPL